MPHDLHLLRPLWLLALLPLAGVLWRLARRGTGATAWQGLVDPHLLPHLLVGAPGRAPRTPLWLLGLGGLLGVIALAGPVWERLPLPVYQAQARRVILLDLSPTMNATDLPPSRLAHARFEVLDLLRRAREGQTALLAYGAEPFLVSPLTADAATIAAQVPNLDSGLLPVQGERREDLALAQAGALLQQVGSPDGEVILVTDGLDHPAAAQEAARRLYAQGYRVSVLGVGSDKGAPVPQADGGFLKDASGAIRMPRLQRDALRTLAGVGGGRYVTASADDRDMDVLIPPGGVQRLQQAEHQERRADQWREQGPGLLLALLPLAALGFRRGWLGPLLLLLCLVPSPPAQAFEWGDLWQRPDQQAARQLAAGRPKEAAEHFQRPDWRAAAHYQAGDYAQALEALGQNSGEQVEYNRGNTLARLGRLEEARAAYDRALAAHPQDADARANRDLVQRLLEQQKQQQPSPQGQPGKAPQDSKKPSNKSDKGPQQDPGQASGEQGQGQSKDLSQGQQKPSDPTEQKPQDSGPDHSPGQAQQGQDKAPQPAAEAKKLATTPAKSQQEQANAAPKQAPDTAQPGRADLLDGKQGQGQAGAVSKGVENPGQREARQAMDYMLNRVPDDPSGLLRQRFLLQHLRRTGEFP